MQKSVFTVSRYKKPDLRPEASIVHVTTSGLSSHLAITELTDVMEQGAV
jgi:hypothetical protein